MTELYAREKLGRMTLRHIAAMKGSKGVKARVLRSKTPTKRVEQIWSVRKVMKKWKEAKESWALRKEGSEKIDLLTKT